VYVCSHLKHIKILVTFSLAENGTKNAKQTLICISTSTKCALFPSVSDPQAYHDVRLSNKHYSIQTFISEIILLNTVLSINYTLFHFNTKYVVHDYTYFNTHHTQSTQYIGNIFSNLYSHILFSRCIAQTPL
jgi:hypothetical protein